MFIKQNTKALNKWNKEKRFKRCKLHKKKALIARLKPWALTLWIVLLLICIFYDMVFTTSRYGYKFIHECSIMYQTSSKSITISIYENTCPHCDKTLEEGLLILQKGYCKECNKYDVGTNNYCRICGKRLCNKEYVELNETAIGSIHTVRVNLTLYILASIFICGSFMVLVVISASRKSNNELTEGKI